LRWTLGPVYRYNLTSKKKAVVFTRRRKKNKEVSVNTFVYNPKPIYKWD